MNIEDAHKLFREVAVQKDGTPSCPFCGSENVEAQLCVNSWTVVCTACGSYGPYMEDVGPMLAIEAWSRRTATPKDWLSYEKRGCNSCRASHGERLVGLAPCPFCGHAELLYEFREPLLNCVYCLVCDAAGAIGKGSREKAISAWNRRL